MNGEHECKKKKICESIFDYSIFHIENYVLDEYLCDFFESIANQICSIEWVDSSQRKFLKCSKSICFTKNFNVIFLSMYCVIWVILELLFWDKFVDTFEANCHFIKKKTFKIDDFVSIHSNECSTKKVLFHGLTAKVLNAIHP